MIDIIFNCKNTFNTSPNYLIEINNDYKFANSNCCFGKLSKTNIFIGENNSGKSRFLRHLFVTNFYSMKLDVVDNIVSSYYKKDIYGVYDEEPENKFEKFNDLYNRLQNKRSSYPHFIESFFNNLQKNSTATSINSKYYFPILRGTKDYKSIINDKLKKFSETAHIQNKDSINHFISLLNLETQGLESFDIYNDIINAEYFKDSNIKNQILTGGKLYQEIKSMLLGEENQRKLIEDFQKFLQENFFPDYDKVQLIPNEQKKVLCVKIGKDERAIYDWGDGTQQLIIILYSLFKYKDYEGKLFFIEEPEMYLHPGVLRKFIEVINSDLFKYHQYFITTHSNIVLDTSADTNINMSIFKFKKVKYKDKNDGKDFLIEQCNNGDMSLLNELGIRNSSLFLSNCSIWVEGITDRLYLKHYLKLYCDKYIDKKIYRENIDYTFIEYGGGNIIHFSFDKDNDFDSNINARYINNKIFLIADNDNSSKNSTKRKRKDYYKTILKDNFYELPVVEIENLVSKEVLGKVLISQNIESENIINEKFSKTLNYRKKHLGKYINDILGDNLGKKYNADSGTIKNKLKFCETVIQQTTNYDMLSDDAKLLIEKIYNFIENSNNV